MILVDTMQIFIGRLLTESKGKPIYSEDLFRHMIIDSIRAIRKNYGAKYGELVLCFDSSSWRKTVFPHYKAGRHSKRDASDFDWNAFFVLLHTIRQELTENFPYRVLHVDSAEADDIIAVLAKRNANSPERTLIVSSDKDFLQLQKYPNVDQWSPIKKSMLKCSDPRSELNEHILRGCDGDGVPNFLSDDDTFVNENKRQTPVRGAKVTKWLRLDKLEDACEGDTKLLANLSRNRMMVDFDCIPQSLQDTILEAASVPPKGTKQTIMSYFMARRMRILMGHLEDF